MSVSKAGTRIGLASECEGVRAGVRAYQAIILEMEGVTDIQLRRYGGFDGFDGYEVFELHGLRLLGRKENSEKKYQDLFNLLWTSPAEPAIAPERQGLTAPPAPKG